MNPHLPRSRAPQYLGSMVLQCLSRAPQLLSTNPPRRRFGQPPLFLLPRWRCSPRQHLGSEHLGYPCACRHQSLGTLMVLQCVLIRRLVPRSCSRSRCHSQYHCRSHSHSCSQCSMNPHLPRSRAPQYLGSMVLQCLSRAPQLLSTNPPRRQFGQPPLFLLARWTNSPRQHCHCSPSTVGHQSLGTKMLLRRRRLLHTHRRGENRPHQSQA